MTVPDFSYPLSPPRERGVPRAILLAVLTHVLLGLFLFYGIRWQNGSPAGAEAELWTDVPSDLQTQTPTPVPVPVEPQPQENAHVAPPLTTQAADIALEQQKRRRQQQEARDAQLAEQRRMQQEAAAQRERQRAAQLEEQKAAKAKARAAAQAKKRDAEYNARVAQMMRQGIGGGAGASGGGLAKNGAGRGSGGRSYDAYRDKVARLVHSNLAPWRGDLHLRTGVRVHLAPDGTQLSASITRHSGNPQWDAIALSAVKHTDPMPRDSNGRAPSDLAIGICPEDCPAN